MGPKQNMQDLCYSQPDTFWYCNRLMTNIAEIIHENQKSEMVEAETKNASDQNSEKSNIGAVDLLNLPKVDM